MPLLSSSTHVRFGSSPERSTRLPRGAPGEALGVREDLVGLAQLGVEEGFQVYQHRLVAGGDHVLRMTVDGVQQIHHSRQRPGPVVVGTQFGTVGAVPWSDVSPPTRSRPRTGGRSPQRPGQPGVSRRSRSWKCRSTPMGRGL